MLLGSLKDQRHVRTKLEVGLLLQSYMPSYSGYCLTSADAAASNTQQNTNLILFGGLNYEFRRIIIKNAILIIR